jgi:hypothetical protein
LRTGKGRPEADIKARTPELIKPTRETGSA